MADSSKTSGPCPEKIAKSVSIVELFTIGIGPSSSHTVGPMRAAAHFMSEIIRRRKIDALEVTLHGSLALTGRGHQSDRACVMGLLGLDPQSIDPKSVEAIYAAVEMSGTLERPGFDPVAFRPSENIIFKPRFVRDHPNTMDFAAQLSTREWIEQRYYSVGGGAIIQKGNERSGSNAIPSLAFSSGKELLEICKNTDQSIADVVRTNELAWRAATETDQFADRIRTAMLDCIDAGIAAEGTLPGGLGVRRRAANIFRDLTGANAKSQLASVFEWVSLWALAVNEENAAGGRVVTAPTNGAAGVIPAVLKYLEDFNPSDDPERSRTFLYTAAAIGFLYKKRASISAAEMGCQGEVGVACSMAAGGLAAALGGTPRQVENAAEIGMEHNLGLTCDPIGGLVQIPCIERNTMGAVKAINAALLALRGDGSHIVSLDQVIETMRQTGIDMRSKYKETSLGGLAVNAVEC